MELEELANRINNRRRLEELEQKPALPYDPADSMETLDEAKDFIRFLFQEKNSREEMLMQEIASLKGLVSQKEKDADTINRLLANIERLMHELSEARAEISRLVSVNSSLVEQ